MAAKVTIEETEDGWHVEATDIEAVMLDTLGHGIVVAIRPDSDDDTGKPLAVSLD